jgi:hypothetical protein
MSHTNFDSNTFSLLSLPERELVKLAPSEKLASFVHPMAEVYATSNSALEARKTIINTLRGGENQVRGGLLITDPRLVSLHDYHRSLRERFESNTDSIITLGEEPARMANTIQLIRNSGYKGAIAAYETRKEHPRPERLTNKSELLNWIMRLVLLGRAGIEVGGQYHWSEPRAPLDEQTYTTDTIRLAARHKGCVGLFLNDILYGMQSLGITDQTAGISQHVYQEK